MYFPLELYCTFDKLVVVIYIQGFIMLFSIRITMEHFNHESFHFSKNHISLHELSSVLDQHCITTSNFWWNNMQNCDDNKDGQINRDEFFGFIQQMAPETFNVVRKKLVATLVVAPTVAATTKKATEQVPGFGKLVQRLPKVVYAALLTILTVWFQETNHNSAL